MSPARKPDDPGKISSAPGARLEALVRSAGVELDRADIARLRAFVSQKVYDLLSAAGASAQANNRALIEAHDLPITRGLQNLINEFKLTGVTLSMGPLLENLSKMPPLDRGASPAAEAILSTLTGAVALGLARAFKIIDPRMKKPGEPDWQKVEQVFDLLL